MEQKNSAFLKAETLVKYFLTDDDETNTLIMCKDPEVELVTSDYALYEALGSVKDNEFNFHKLVKLLEVVEIVSLKKTLGKEKEILTEKRVEELRSFKQEDDKNVR